MNLKGKSFLKLLDFTPSEIEYLIDLAADLKAKKKAGIPHKLCEGKSIALVFELLYMEIRTPNRIYIAIWEKMLPRFSV